MSERMWEELQQTRAERDRLQRELEAWREALKSLPLNVVVGSERVPLLYPLPDLIGRLDAILRGES